MRDLYIRSMSLREMPPADSWLSALPVVRHLAAEGLTFHRQVTFLVGENGAGKSTLIEALAISQGFNAEGGSRNFNFTTAATHSDLHSYLRVTRGAAYPRTGYFLRAESFYNVASNIDDMDAEGGGPRVIDSYGGVSLHRQSHGESFMSLVENRFGGKGLYILDEPEAALSPMRVMGLIAHMKRLVDDESQFLVSTHSPMLMAFPGADVLLVGDGGIERVDYRDTEHYQVTRRFLEDPERMFRYLFEG
ncbi:MAG TPA: ABC transporter ATP-binding protein [Eggerthellaceae bacterium]|nr:ABC transporter ATP-binding protein [Eggerthellaceae bacterium]